MVRTRSTKPVSASTRSASTAVALSDTKVGSTLTTDSDKNGIQSTSKTTTPTKSSSSAKLISASSKKRSSLSRSHDKSNPDDDNLNSSTLKSPQSAKKLTSDSNKKPIETSIASAESSSGVNVNNIKPQEQQQHIEFEFNGPIGAFAIIFGLPLVIYLLYFACNQDICLTYSSILSLSFDTTKFMSLLPHTVNDLFSYEAIIIYIGWMGFHIVCERLLPGETVEGVPLPNGKRLIYVMSGHLQFWLCILAMGHALPTFTTSVISGDVVYNIKGFSPLPLYLVYDHYVQLITISCLGALMLSVYVYIASFRKGVILAHGGNTGYMIYDFFIGRELNPRIGTLDLKEFCELRPGLIGWCVINLGMACKQYMKRAAQQSVNGRGGSISLSMFFVTLSQGLYVWDALYQEKAILSTMDITTDGFGYMLAFGDLAWVPFIYSLQTRYLVDHDPQLPLSHCAAALLVQCLGFYIFRAANSEKDLFRKDPDSPAVAHLSYLQTARGTKLITSGWWGAARKINYTGDWLLTFSWCLLCGYDSPIPYFQAVYFLILLIHRAIRDDKMCADKYGTDWIEYKRRVPYLFIPYMI